MNKFMITIKLIYYLIIMSIINNLPNRRKSSRKSSRKSVKVTKINLNSSKKTTTKKKSIKRKKRPFGLKLNLNLNQSSNKRNNNSLTAVDIDSLIKTYSLEDIYYKSSKSDNLLPYEQVTKELMCPDCVKYDCQSLQLNEFLEDFLNNKKIKKIKAIVGNTFTSLDIYKYFNLCRILLRNRGYIAKLISRNEDDSKSIKTQEDIEVILKQIKLQKDLNKLYSGNNKVCPDILKFCIIKKEDGSYLIYFIQEHINGVTFKQYYDDYDDEPSIKVLTLLNDKLEKIHKLGFQHGDLNSGNIMFKKSKSGEILENKILIIDFDRAKELNFNLNLSNDVFKHIDYESLLRGVSIDTKLIDKN